MKKLASISSARGHTIIRTSPKGGAFIGKCLVCGAGGLRASDANKPCSGKARRRALLGRPDLPVQ